MSDSDEPLSFEEHKRRRDDNPKSGTVHEVRKTDSRHSDAMPGMRSPLSRRAQEFTHESEHEPRSRGTPPWVIAVAVVLLLAILLGVIGYDEGTKQGAKAPLFVYVTR